MRAINTAQAQMRPGRTNYGSLQEVVSHRSFSPTVGAPTLEDDDTARIRNHRIMVLRSQDGRRYQASIVPLAGSGAAIFSDQNGLIFVGEVLR
jgi:hypothetical protein